MSEASWPRRAGLLCLNAATVLRLGLNSGCIHKWNIHKFVGFRRAGCSCEAWASFSLVLNHSTTLRLIAHLPSANTSVIYVLLWPPVQIWLDMRVPSEEGRALARGGMHFVAVFVSGSSERLTCTCSITKSSYYFLFPDILFLPI